MNSNRAIVYISNNNSVCDKLTEKMDEWNVDYKTKNISNDQEIKKELQDQGIYGTPATFVEGCSEPILGYQLNKLKRELNIWD